MQKDLDRLRKRKRRLQKALTLIIVTFALAFILVAIKSCGKQFDEPYNKEYRPVDIAPQQQSSQEQ